MAHVNANAREAPLILCSVTESSNHCNV